MGKEHRTAGRGALVIGALLALAVPVAAQNCTVTFVGTTVFETCGDSSSWTWTQPTDIGVVSAQPSTHGLDIYDVLINNLDGYHADDSDDE